MIYAEKPFRMTAKIEQILKFVYVSRLQSVEKTRFYPKTTKRSKKKRRIKKQKNGFAFIRQNRLRQSYEINPCEFYFPKNLFISSTPEGTNNPVFSAESS